MGGVYSTTISACADRGKDERPDMHMETPVLAAALLNYAYIYSPNSIKFSLMDFS